jgi:poly-gamma-glutamate synthesis protein (capsule biosynthesis protein)
MNKKLILLFLSASFLFTCINPKPILSVENKIEETTEIPDEPEHIPIRHTLTFVAAGDNLFHETIINTSLVNGVYNFDSIYTPVKDIIENADLAFINQETVMGGASFGYSGYPAFNTPQSLAGTLARTGFDIVNQANNHAMDMGRAGLYATLDLWDTIEGITVIGARKAGESMRIISANNITLGFLSYTYGLNGLSLPRDNPNLVSLINRNTMTREIEALRPLCDFLVVSMHWGEEYMLIEPSAGQISLAQFLAQLDVDLIIGHHPHVLQRFEKLPRANGKETFCFYSLGNFVSHQIERERILGAMIALTFVKEDDLLYISDAGLIPVVCHFERGYANTAVYPFYKYSEELLRKHVLVNMGRDLSYSSFNNILNRMDTKIIMRNPFID